MTNERNDTRREWSAGAAIIVSVVVAVVSTMGSLYILVTKTEDRLMIMLQEVVDRVERNEEWIKESIQRAHDHRD